MKYQPIEQSKRIKASSRPETAPATAQSPFAVSHLQRTIGNQAVQQLFSQGSTPAGTPPLIQRTVHARYERMWEWAINKNLLSPDAVAEIRDHVAPLEGQADTAILDLVSLSNWANKAFKDEEKKRQAQALIWKKLHESDWDLNAASLVREQVKNAPILVTDENDAEILEQVKGVFHVNTDLQLMDALWANSLNLFQKQQLASLLFNEGKLRMATLNYLLEAIDPKHRYGLMFFARNWLREEHTATPFFEWIEAQEGVADQSVAYLSKNEREDYRLKLGPRIKKADDSPLVGKNIFVMTDNKKFYGATKETGRLHHSTFLGGQKVRGAGELITDGAGKLTEITDYSGHYQPNKKEMQGVMQVLKGTGINLSQVKYVDNQNGRDTTAARYLRT